jgi:hypothetical protein
MRGDRSQIIFEMYSKNFHILKIIYSADLPHQHDARHRILDVAQPIRPFSHAPQASQFICHAKNVVYDVAYPMHVWRLFINLEIHAREARWPRCTLCSSRAHVSRHMLHGYEKDKKKEEKKRRHRSLRDGRCRNVDEHAVERIKTIVMQLRGRFASYRLGRWVELIIPSFSPPCNYNVTKRAHNTPRNADRCES